MKSIDIMTIAMFVAMMAVAANITAIFPFLVFAGIPLTFQPLIAILAGAVLGSRRGAVTMVVYTIVGLLGAPVFAQFHAGPAMLVRPTFGFILSFIVAAYVVGKIIEKSHNPQLFTYIIASFIGLAFNYFIGTHWVYFAYVLGFNAPDQFTYGIVWLGMLPLLIKDIFFTIAAAVIAQKLPESVKRPFIGKGAVSH
ncbi:biotin transport system substrate-specific component [Geomicrobium halophilum]|uniref:Biotin transporter n=1 Tax=Geomicrobium halophilum TaxID=549000 RepID=A0A841PMV1_9BACL|nr:biotin transporter BioY [Geomicrobium halophilum]MBB6450177.1 biotin transport system substrate-specific component [Geomicrobium halophilum]